MPATGPRQRSYTDTIALPNGAATVYGKSLDLGMFLVTLGDLPIVITAPALNSTQLPAGQTIAYTIQGSDTTDFTIYKDLMFNVLTQAPGTAPVITAVMGVNAVAVGAQSGTFAQATTTATASAPSAGGATATFSVTVTGGAVASITPAVAGTKYLTPPTITVADSGNPSSTCAATATLKVVSLNIVSGGSNLVTTAVTFSGGGGSGAAATLTLTLGVATNSTVSTGGTLYTSPPAVAIATSGAPTTTLTVNLPRKLSRFVRLRLVKSGSGDASGSSATVDIEA